MAVNVADLIATLRADTSQFQSGMKSATSEMFKIGTSSVAAGNLISQALTSAASKASEFATFAYRAAEATAQWAENVGFLADRTGLSEEFLIGMEPALNRVGLTADDLALGFRRLAVNVQESGDAGSKASLLFERLGINIEQLSGNPEQALIAISEAVRRLPPGFIRTAEVGELLGSRLQRLIPLLLEGADGFKRSSNEATAMGLRLSGPVRENLKRLDDALDDVNTSWANFTRHVGVESAKTVEWYAHMQRSVLDWASSSVESFGRVGATMTIFGMSIAKWKMIWDALKETGPNASFSEIATAILKGSRAADEYASSLKQFGPPLATAQQSAKQLAIDTEKAAEKTGGLTKSAQDLREAMKPVKLLNFDESLKSANAFWAQYVATIKSSLDLSSAMSEQNRAKGIISEQQFVSDKNNMQKEENIAIELSLVRQLDVHREFIGKKRALLEQDRSIQGQVALKTFDLQSAQELIDILDKLSLARQKTQTDIIRGKTAEAAASMDAAKIQLEASASMASSELQIAQANHADNSVLRELRLKEIEINAQRELAVVGLTQEQITAIYRKGDADRASAVTQFPNAFDRAMQDIINSSSFSMGTIVNQFSGAMADWMMGINSFQNFWKNAMRSLAQAFINEALANMAKAALASGMGGMFTGFLGKLFGSGATSGPIIDAGSTVGTGGTVAAPSIMLAAEGGIATRPTLGIFGEAGPEALIPLDRYDAAMGGRSQSTSPVNISITVNAGKGGGTESGGGAAPNFDQLARSLSQLVERKIIDEQRPGGLLSGMA